ncbi:MAG: ABC transporter substrate-binding protein [Saccharofermentanales bacterium]
MKNMLIRFTSISMVLLMLLTVTSCGEKTPTPSSSGQESSTESPAADFKGSTIVVASWSETGPELGESTGEDALYNSFEKAKEKFNCDVEWLVTAQSDHFSKVISNSLSGTVYADIIMSHSWNHVGLINQNILTQTDKYLDAMTEEERSNWMTDMCYFKGHYYGLNPRSRVVLPTLNLFYNRTILEELKLQDPQELALAGTWDWDTFYDYCIAATDSSKNRFGSAIFNLDAVLGAANGVETVVFDDNDSKYYNGFTHTDSQFSNLAVVEFIQKLAQNGALLGLWPQGPEAMDEAENGFLDGQTLFTYAQNGERLKTLGMDNFGVVTAPIADFNESKALYNTTASFVYWAIPAKTTYPADDLAEFWMYAQTTWDESRGDAYYEFDLNEYRELLLSMTYTDMKDVDFLLDMRDGVIEKPSLDLAISLGSLVARDIFAEVVAGNMTPSAAIATVDNQIQAKIDESLNIN